MRYVSLLCAVVVTWGMVAAAQAALVAHYEFDEGSGATAVDSVGGLDATVSGATWTTDRHGQAGQAIQCGRGDWVDPPDSLKYPVMTLSAWVYLDAYGGANANEAPIFSAEKGHGASNFGYRLQVDHSGKLIMEAIAPVSNGSTRSAISDTTLDLNRWYHVAGTYDGYTTSVYIDGQSAGSSSATTYLPINTASAIPVGIGHLPGWSVQWFQGRIDDARVYSHAMSAADVAAEADAGPGGPSAAASPEPTALGLLGLGALALIRRRR